MTLIPVEFLSDNSDEKIYARIKRFDGKFYNLNNKLFGDDSTSLIPLVRGKGLDKSISNITLDVEETEFLPGYYIIYFHDDHDILDIESFEIYPKFPTVDEIANRIMSCKIGNKTLRECLLKL